MDPQDDKKQNKKSGSFLAKFKSIFGSDKKNSAPSGDKNVLVDYSKVFQEERSERKKERDSLLYKKNTKPKYPEPAEQKLETDDEQEAGFSKNKNAFNYPAKESAGEKKAARSQSRGQQEEEAYFSGSDSRQAKTREQARTETPPSPGSNNNDNKGEGFSQKKEKKKSGKNSRSIQDFWEWIKEKTRSFKQKKLDSSNTLKTNLIEGGGEISFDYKFVFKTFGISLGFALAVSASLYGGVFYWESKMDKKADNLDAEIERLEEIAENKEEKISKIGDLQKKVEIADILLKEHIYWTNFFDFIEKHTLPNVYYESSFSGDIEGSYSFSAVTDDYKSISEQAAVLQQHDKVVSAQVNSGNLSFDVKEQDENSENDSRSINSTAQRGQTVSFGLQLQLDTDIFH